MLGFSQKEKDFKQLKLDVEEAKKEISNHNFNRFLSLPADNATIQDMYKLVELRIHLAAGELKYLTKVLPDLFTPKQKYFDARWANNAGKSFYAQVPEKWYFILDDDRFVDNEKARTKLTELLNKLISKK